MHELTLLSKEAFHGNPKRKRGTLRQAQANPPKTIHK